MEQNGNQGPTQPSNNFSFYEENQKGKKKKGIGPIKGLFIAIVIVLIICGLGLLARMVIAGDGDYFKPIKTIFGIEGEEEKKDRKSSNRVETKSDVLESKSGFSERYQYLATETEDADVKHYRMTLDLSDIIDNLYEQMSNAQDSYNSYYDDDYDSSYDDDDYDSNYDDEDYLNNYFKQTTDLSFSDEATFYNNSAFDNTDDEFDFDDYNEDTDINSDDINSDDIYSDERFRSNFDTDEDAGSSYIDDSLESKITDYASSFGLLMSKMGEQIKSIVSGEIYVDIYFKGNDIVQVVCGIDYSDLIQNLYDYVLENADEETMEEMESEGIESVEDYAEYILNKIEESFDMEDVYDGIFEDGTTADDLKKHGLSENDIKNAIEIKFDKGLVEFYFTGSKKINNVISDYFESDEFKQELKELSKEGVEIDEKNIIEDMINYSNDNEESQEYGIEFVEVEGN